MNYQVNRFTGSLFLFTSMLLTGLGVLTAQVPPAEQLPEEVELPMPEPAVSPGGPQDPAELETFLDGWWAAAEPAHHLSGATISVVKDGREIFSKGYGFVDVDKQVAVDPRTSLFRIGSVSKLFVWTSVMQLYEQGRLSLTEDVNRYLRDFQIPATYDSPITLEHLMTHSPGFEDVVIGLFARNADGLAPLNRLLPTQIPARVRPPGLFVAYSNHGTALAAHIVETVSGMSFDDYVEQHIFQPLGMAYTTFRQPVPELLQDDVSGGYSYSNGEFSKKDFEFVPLYPAGSVSASASDMARFMITHLQLGRFEDTRILDESTALKMHSRLFGHVEDMNGMLHGFYQMNQNGQTIFGHGGDTLWFHSQLTLLPQYSLGIFASFNSDTGGAARSQLTKAFIDHYFPAPEQSEPLKVEADSLQRFTGYYQALRRSYKSLAKVASLFGNVSVTVDPEGLLVMTGLGEGARKFVPIGPLQFREKNKDERIAFLEDGNGNITHLLINAVPVIDFAKVTGADYVPLHYWGFGLSLVLFLSAAVFWPLAAWCKRGRQHPVEFQFQQKVAKFLGFLTSALLLGFVILSVIGLSDPMQIVFGMPPVMKVALWLPLLSIVPALGTLILAFVAWNRHFWGFLGRAHYTLVAFAGPVFIALLYYWNLLGFNY